MEVSAALNPFGDIFNGIFNGDPLILATQIALGIVAGILVYLVFFATRDILGRTDSLLFQLSSILLVAVIPVGGFLLYLLVRPSATLKQKRMQESLDEVLSILSERKGKIDAIKQKAMSHVSVLKKIDANESVKKAALPVISNIPANA
ncbi:MAG TPA: hypothetical protein VJB82_01400 [Candidatus Peribacterales bacterium]|nr:hypothetical protein [Candidatus Peribacterales bacterium]